MEYPGRIIKTGEADARVIAALRAALRARGYEVAATGPFDTKLASVIKLFQAQHFDANHQPLKADGVVGPITWSVLCAVTAAPSAPPVRKTLALMALHNAIGEIGTTEVPPGSNKGPKIEQYLSSVGLDGGHYWCMAFVHWCFREAAKEHGLAANPFPKTGGCLDAWNKTKKAAPQRILTKDAVKSKPSLLKPGAVLILDYGHGKGHTGFVESVNGGTLTTIEGNSDPAGGRNGIGVFRLRRRNIMDGNLKGFLDFQEG